MKNKHQKYINEFDKEFTYAFTETDFLRHIDTRMYFMNLIEAFLIEKLEQNSQEVKEEFKGKTKRIAYMQGYREAIADMIDFLNKHKYVSGTKELTIFTVNPLILELQHLKDKNV